MIRKAATVSETNHFDAPHPSDESREIAALYALGILDSVESFETHLLDGCTACREDVRTFRTVLESMCVNAAPQVSPPPSVKRRIMDSIRTPEVVPSLQEDSNPGPSESADGVQIWKQWSRTAGSELAPGLFTLRSSEGTWEDTDVDGVRVRPLYVDPDRGYVTMLVRMDPGASYPSHVHAGAEECYVLEGDLEVAGASLTAGDYQRAESDSLHGVQSTKSGCLLLITSSQHDRLC